MMFISLAFQAIDINMAEREGLLGCRLALRASALGAVLTRFARSSNRRMILSRVQIHFHDVYIYGLPGHRYKHGGERGIRTLDTLLTYTPLAGERLQPLGHLSG